jgi:hypothetical protein
MKQSGNRNTFKNILDENPSEIYLLKIIFGFYEDCDGHVHVRFKSNLIYLKEKLAFDGDIFLFFFF